MRQDSLKSSYSNSVLRLSGRIDRGARLCSRLQGGVLDGRRRTRRRRPRARGAMRSRSGRANELVAYFKEGITQGLCDLNRQGDNRLRERAREDINPPGSIVMMASLDLGLVMMRWFFQFKEVRVNGRRSVSVIVCVVCVKERRAEPREEDRAQTKKCPKPTHARIVLYGPSDVNAATRSGQTLQTLQNSCSPKGSVHSSKMITNGES